MIDILRAEILAYNERKKYYYIWRIFIMSKLLKLLNKHRALTACTALILLLKMGSPMILGIIGIIWLLHYLKEYAN